MRRLNTLIEAEIEVIKQETAYDPPSPKTTITKVDNDNNDSDNGMEFISRVYDLFIDEDLPSSLGRVESDKLAILLLHLNLNDSEGSVKSVQKVVDADSSAGAAESGG